MFLKNKDNRKRFAHIVAGIVILIHAYEKYESGHSSYTWFTLAGIVFLTLAIFHPVIEKRVPWIDGAFFIIEGILSILVAYDFFHMGKKALPYTYVALAFFQFFMAFKKSKKGIEHHKTNLK